MKKSRILMGLAMSVLLISALCGCSSKQEPFPSKEISLVVPFGSGGGTDLLARTLADPAGKKLGKGIVVTNVVGAAGTVGSAQLATADPDGYTITFTATAPIAIQPYFMGGLSYNPDSFTYICNVASEPTCIAVNANSPYKTLADLVAAGKAGKELTLGNTGVGTLHYLFQRQLFGMAKIPYKQVAYAGGAKLVTGLLGGNVDAMSTVVSEMYDYVKAGQIRILAVSTPKRSPLYKDIPTAKESGYDISMSLDFFVAAPKKIPDDVKKTLTATFAEAAKSDVVTKFLGHANIAPNYMDGDALAAKIKKDADMYKKIVDSVK